MAGDSDGMMMMMIMMMGGCFCIVVAVGAFFLFPDVFGMGSTPEESSSGSGDGTGSAAADGCVPVPITGAAPDVKPQNNAATCNAKCTYGKDLLLYKSDGTAWKSATATECTDTVDYTLPSELSNGVTIRVSKKNVIEPPTGTANCNYIATSTDPNHLAKKFFVGMWTGPNGTTWDPCHLQRCTWKFEKSGKFYKIKQIKDFGKSEFKLFRLDISQPLVAGKKDEFKVLLSDTNDDYASWYVFPAFLDNKGRTTYAIINVKQTLDTKKPWGLTFNRHDVTCRAGNTYKNSAGMWALEVPPTVEGGCPVP